MEVHSRRYADGSWAARPLFVMGLIGLIVAVSGFTWLMIGHAQFEYQLAQQNAKLAQQNAKLAQRLARYSGTWVNKQGLSVTRLKISNNELAYTIVVFDDAACPACELGESNGTFSSEPITILISSANLNLTMILNNTKGTQLKVIVVNNDTRNSTYTAIFDKSGP